MKKILLPVFCLSLFFYANCSGGGSAALTPDLDTDADGSFDSVDCDPSDATISPDQDEVFGDGIDQDCSGQDKYVTKSTTKADEDGDGTFEGTTLKDYDAEGNIVKIDRDNGVSHNITESEFDNDNHLTKQSYDSNADGTFENVLSQTYNASGSLTHLVNDVGNDGIIDHEEIYEFNAAEKRTKAIYKDNGILQRTVTYTYNAEGLEIEHLNKKETAPINEVKIVSVYDADGNQIESYYYLDGILLGQSFNTYDSKNQLTSSCTDGDLDFICNQIRYFFYDSEGNTTKIEADGDGAAQADGSIDFLSTYTTENLSGGRTKFKNNLDTNNDGTIDSLEYRILDAAENTLESGEDSNADGTPDNYQRNTFNEFNLVTQYFSDTNGDGAPESVQETEYEYSE